MTGQYLHQPAGTRHTWQQLRAEVERGGEQAFYTEPGVRRPGEVEMVVAINQPAVRRAYRRLVAAEPECASSNAAYPQVASQPHDPTKGWLRRLFDRWKGQP